MKRLFLIQIVLLSSLAGYAQQGLDAQKVDTEYTYRLSEFKVTARWKNDTERYHYNQMKHYITLILPYVDAASKLFKEVNAKSEEPDLTRKEWKQYVAGKEDEMRTRFEDKIKDLNVTQGGLLVKLIARQTNLNIYHIVEEFKNPFAAMKWQTWARLHGMNLDKKYHPEDEPMLELIMEDLGYPLPESYRLADAGK